MKVISQSTNPQNDPAKRYWVVASLILGLVSFCKGVRLPSRWAATQALVSYDFGFVKRGFVGATIGHWFHTERYLNFSISSYLALILMIVVVAGFAIRSGILSTVSGVQIATLFFSSYSVTFLAHLVGYLDIYLILGVTALLWIRRPEPRFAASLPIVSVALLIHENFLLMFLPVLLFSFILDASKSTCVARRKRLFQMCAALLLLCFLAALRLTLLAPMAVDRTKVLQAAVTQRADFPIREDFFAVMSRSVLDNVVIMEQHFFHNGAWLLSFFIALVVFLPLAFMMIKLCFQAIDGFPFKRNLWLKLGVICAALSPLTLNLFGWDCGRWDAMMCLNAFLLLLLLIRHVPDHPLLLSVRLQVAIVVVIALNMATGDGLMDQKHAHPYPFASSFKSLTESVSKIGWRAPDL